ncbi:hypothetical protein [Longispora urticae]
MTDETLTPTAPEADQVPRDVQAAAKDLESGAHTPGSVSITNRMRRSAGAMFNGSVDIDGGTLIGRDQHNYSVHLGAEVSLKLLPVAASEVDLLRQTFLPPTGYDRLLTIARSRRLLILQAPPGHGRATTALRLLWDLGVRDLHRVAPGGDLSQLRRDQIRAGSGYLLADVSDADAKGLQGDLLRGIDAMLEAADARMVLTVSAHAAVSAPEVQSRLVPLGAPADGLDIVRQHLRVRVGQQVADALLADRAAVHALQELLRDDRGLGRAARLALICVEERTDSALVVDRIRERAAREESADFAAWFDDLADIQLRCQAISLAAFHGLAYGSMAALAESLRKAVERPNQVTGAVAGSSGGAMDPFGRSRATRMRLLRARITQGSIPTLHGDVPTEVVTYLNPRYPGALLQRIWHEYDGLRTPMLEWLRNAGGHADESVRIWAAEAVGLLAHFDFSWVLRSVITPWAASRDARRQEAAAFALALPAAVDFYDQVSSVLQSWSTEDAKTGLQITAARAYGASVGRKAPEQALRQLAALVRNDNFDVALAVGRSLADLIDHQRSLAPQVLSTLDRWARGGSQQQLNAAQLAFLIVAGETVTTDDEATPWPLLLRLADEDDTLRGTVAGLWRTALNGTVLNRPARAVLGEWAAAVERYPRPRAAFGRLCWSIAADPRSAALAVRTKKILFVLADSWSGDASGTRGQAPRAAAALRANLS